MSRDLKRQGKLQSCLGNRFFEFAEGLLRIVGRLVVDDCFRFALPNNAAFIDDGQTIAGEGIFHGMGYYGDGFALVCESTALSPETITRRWVEHGGGFVEHKGPRRHSNEPSCGKLLLLAAGKFVHLAFCQFKDSLSIERLVYDCVHVAVTDPAIFQAKSAIVLHGGSDYLIVGVLKGDTGESAFARGCGLALRFAFFGAEIAGR